MSLPSRIFLIGLPGSGKSTVGRGLAKEMEYDFLDLDEVIEKAVSKSISSIFSDEGEEAFRKIESSELSKITDEKLVIATGGGTPCFHENMGWMNKNGFTIFLNQPLSLLAERLSSETHRPLIGQSPMETLEALSRKRKSFYEQAGMESSHSEPCEILTELHNFFTRS